VSEGPPPYRVEFIPVAGRQLTKLPAPGRQRVEAILEALAAEPRPPGARALVGTDALRVRVGDYRVIYWVDDSVRLVEVLRIAHRREVYRRL